MLSAEYRRVVGRHELGRRVLLGTAGAVLGVVACFLVASGTGAPLMVAVRDTGATAVTVGAAVLATAVAGVGAYLLARRSCRSHRPRRIFLAWTTAGLLVSAVPPLQASTTVSTALWLLVMHAVAALALVPAVASALPSVRSVAGQLVGPPAATSITGSAAAGDHQ